MDSTFNFSLFKLYKSLFIFHKLAHHILIFLSACAHISTSIGRNSRLHPLCVLCNICCFDCNTFMARHVMICHFANFDDNSWKSKSFDLYIIYDDFSV